MGKPTDIRITDVGLYFLPVQTRVPLKFGAETLTSVTCARACVTATDRTGRSATGWGETPLSVQWAWPSSLAYGDRLEAMRNFCIVLSSTWASFNEPGHPIEIGSLFLDHVLEHLLEEYNKTLPEDIGPMPLLAALICCSAFDIALHDAYGKVHDVPIYAAYSHHWLNRDLAHFLGNDSFRNNLGEVDTFRGRYPSDYLLPYRGYEGIKLDAWHLVGGVDPIIPDDLPDNVPQDGYPVLLDDWIVRDGLRCLKIKLSGVDRAGDYQRIIDVGLIALEHGVDWLSTDFNCTVIEPWYVIDILEQLQQEQPKLYGMILYVEQPFPYDIDTYPIDVRGLSAIKPLFMDESAHNWRLIRRGRDLGWSGVALKTCKTQTGALLSLCWAKAHGMSMMVQDLTNPMLAQIPHLLLAAHAGTIMGVETNSMQFYPEASGPEARVHPGLYRRKHGCVDLSSIQGPGFGYRLEEIERELPELVVSATSAA